jgi:hypothetical protein
LLLPKTMSPGPCLFPARTRFGGLSTIDMKFGSSAGAAFARRELFDICRHAGHWNSCGLLILRCFGEALGMLPNCRITGCDNFIVVRVNDSLHLLSAYGMSTI